MTGVRQRGDALLIGVLVAAWAAVFVPFVIDVIDGGRDRITVVFNSAPDGDSHAHVLGWNSRAGWDPMPELGDELIAIDGSSAAGCTQRTCVGRLIEATADDRVATVTLERDGERYDARIRQTPLRNWFAGIPFSVALLATGVLLAARSDWHLRRRWLVGSAMWSVLVLTAFDNSASSYAITLALWPVAAGLTVLNAQDFTRSAHPVPRAVRALAVAAALLSLLSFSVNLFASISRPMWFALGVGQIAFFAGACMHGLFRCYRRSDPFERRQVRSAMVGFYITLLSMFVGPLVAWLAPHDEGLQVAGAWLTSVLLLGIPVGILIGIVGYQWLDVDRIISSTATSTVIGGAAVVTILTLVPSTAGDVGSAVGLSAGVAQSLLTLIVAAIAVPLVIALRPQVHRRMFTDHHQQTLGFEQLLDALSRCTSAIEITQLTGDSLDTLLQPSSIAIYAREEQAFTPVYIRGRTAPPAFDADSPLLHTLDKRIRPLSADSERLDPFDRAALETLDGAVVVPTRLDGAVIAFTCLGRKTDGDIYTPEELAYLMAAASRASDALARIDGDAIIRDAQQMQQALRRYVPGAVADALASGTDLAAAEHDVSVLFVDIRGYTTFAENRQSQDVFSAINLHTERVSRAVRDRGGAVVEFHGDGLVAVFGAPEPLPEKERAAVEAARDIVTSLPDDVQVGVGIATGPAHVGNIRAADRMIWTVIGDTANLASRLQSLTRDLDAAIAVDTTTNERAGYVCVDFDRHEDVAIKGRRRRCEVWALPISRTQPVDYPSK